MAAVFDYGVLVTTAATADQVVKSVTYAAATNLKLIVIGAAYTAFSGTEANLGIGEIQVDPDGGGWDDAFEQRFQNTDLDNNCGMTVLPLGSGISFASGQDIRSICTPASTTSMRWKASFWGET